MEVNRDEAQRALEIAQRKWSAGDKLGALRLARKSNSLFPTAEAQKLVSKLEALKEGGEEPSAAKSAEEPIKGSSANEEGLRNRKANNASAGANGDAEKKSYTQEQVTSVREVMKVRSDYYKVLGVEKTATSVEIKKAYRKKALVFHPDKNTAPGADEAFKLVASAFTTLSDDNKRAHYDRFGSTSDRIPESSGFAGRSGRDGMGPMFTTGRAGAEDISPEDLFNMFFGGEFGQFGVQFGPNARFSTSQYGRPMYTQYRRQQQHARRGNEEDNSGVFGSCLQYLPLLLLFLSYFASSIVSLLFGGGEAPPTYSFSPTGGYSNLRVTQLRNVKYWVNANEFVKSSVVKTPSELRQFEIDVEAQYISMLQRKCQEELRQKNYKLHLAHNWLGMVKDKKLLKEAESIKLPSCDELKKFR
ncbi:Chaperone protein dnaJ [Dipsacomyces acuminosporus]|nr:Chaperone protein dnaJ [Dipsacomyces acuminosporus]